MDFNIGAETVNFFLSLLLGIIFGIIYDVFRILRLAIKHKTATVFVEDIAFFILIAFISFTFSLASTKGNVRAYQIIGQISGFALYIATLGEATLFFADKIILTVKLLISLFKRFLILPVLKIIAKILKILLYPFKFLISLCKKGLKKGKFTLKKKGIILYNLKSRENSKGNKENGKKERST